MNTSEGLESCSRQGALLYEGVLKSLIQFLGFKVVSLRYCPGQLGVVEDTRSLPFRSLWCNRLVPCLSPAGRIEPSDYRRGYAQL